MTILMSAGEKKEYFGARIKTLGCREQDWGLLKRNQFPFTTTQKKKKDRKYWAWEETEMQSEFTCYFLSLKKNLCLAATLKKLGRKLRMFPGFADAPRSVPQKSGLSVLNTLLLFDTVSRGTASQPQGAWQGNEKWISRVTVYAFKDDFRAQNQEKGHKRFIASDFQKVELQIFFSHGFYKFRVPLLIFGGYIKTKQNKTNLHSSTFKIIFCFTSV